MFKRKNTSEKDKTFERNPNFTWDMELRYKTIQSEQRAWLFTKISIACFILSVIALVLLTPLKTVEPYIIRVDQTTGMTDIVEMQDFKISSKDEAITKYFINKFVIARESYELTQLEEDFYITRELTLPNVFSDYSKQFKGNESLQKKYKDSVKIVVKVESIIDNLETKVATVRFSKHFIDTKNGGIETKVEYWIAQIAYTYMVELTLTENKRLINPLGFKVTDYRLNPEIRSK